MIAIAKTDRSSNTTRTLIGHSLDVAYAARAMLRQGASRDRLSAAAGMPLTDVHVDRLAVLVGLHDFGKATRGFQDRIRGRSRGSGHVAEALAVLGAAGKFPDAVRAALRDDLLNGWCKDAWATIYAIICHHGEPVGEARIAQCAAGISAQWAASAGDDPVAEVAALMDAMLAAFPGAMNDAEPFPDTTRFQHALAGLVMTADWMGSDARWYPVAGPDDRPEVANALLADTRWSGWHTGAAPETVLGGRMPRAAQEVVLTLPLTERLVVLEAPTGTGKTEASVMWASRLVSAGLVDGLYFAVPTRSAATEIHARIASMMSRVHPLLTARTVRAVPGMLDTDHATQRWDEPSEPTWAIGSTRRVMGAPVAVGTIDQAMLSQMKVRHGHLRAWCLARHLLVIDEVHASDPYMSEIVSRLVDEHLALGGYALLMSATLGETMRARLEGRRRLGFANAVARVYPLVSAGVTAAPVPVPEMSRRRVDIVIEDQTNAIARVLATVGRAEPVLWIRSTVADAIADHRKFASANIPTLLHHSRYADDDRQYLDRQVLAALGPLGLRTGIVVVSTQTCEQSLDIDADLLVTDAVPADVLLQRLGRLHRHRTGTCPTAVVLEPGSWDARVTKDGEALGAPGHGWAWVYNPLAVRETIEWLRPRGCVVVPDDVRAMVETATHADYLEARARAYGERWLMLWNRLYGRATAERQQALAALVDRSLGYEQALVDAQAQTRLGDGSIDIDVNGALVSPFTGAGIERLAIRATWLHNTAPGTPARVVGYDKQGAGGTVRTRLDIGGVGLAYSTEGLVRCAVAK
jgi:CRISPR-associated endonuclease/helicase Cas3